MESDVKGRVEYYWVDILAVNRHFPWHVLRFFYTGADKQDLMNLPPDQMRAVALQKLHLAEGQPGDVVCTVQHGEHAFASA